MVHPSGRVLNTYRNIHAIMMPPLGFPGVQHGPYFVGFPVFCGLTDFASQPKAVEKRFNIYADVSPPGLAGNLSCDGLQEFVFFNVFLNMFHHKQL
jgi:hypothetical protein